MNNYDVIIKPVLTEKSYAEVANKKYVFKVNKDATKVDIKNAVEKIFNVKVEKVNTLITKPKTKSKNTKSGREVGKTATYKKAIVMLTKESKTIEFFDSLN